MANKAYISSKQTYYNIDMGDSGIAKVNLKTGLLSTVTSLATLPGNNLPLNLELVYNSGQLNDYYMGNGCKLNVMQKIQVLSHGDIEYTDAGEWKHTFAKQNDGQQDFWVDQSGTGLTMTLQDSNYVMHASSDLQYVFSGGKLVQIKNKFNKTMTITYSGEKVTNVTDGIGRQAVFAYGTDGNLSSITILKPNETDIPTSGRYKVEFNYDSNGNLDSYILPGKGETSLSYSSDTDETGTTRYYLSSVCTPCDREFDVTYYTGKKVKRVTYYVNKSTISQNGTVSGYEQPEKIAFSYADEHTTYLQNKKGVTTTYMFDNDGTMYASFEGSATYTSGDVNYASSGKNTVQFNATIPHGNTWVNNSEYTADYTQDACICQIANVATYKGKMMVLSGFAKLKNASETGNLALALKVTTTSGVEWHNVCLESNHTHYQFGATAIYVPDNCTSLEVWAKVSDVTAQFSKLRFTLSNASASQSMFYLRNESGTYTTAKAKSQMLAIKYKKDGVFVQRGIDDFSLYDLQKLLSQATYPKIVYCKNGTEVITGVTETSIVLTDNTELSIPAATFVDSKKVSGPELGSMLFSQQGVFYTRTKQYDADKITNLVQGSYVVETSNSPDFFANVATAEYNQLGRLTKSTNSRGIVTENVYDDHGNV
ncbi:MAG: hypothetical protein IJ999_06060, partial [Clostridia bacterium]|nr:hypothetical protein [Clostridia bacterium]